MQRLDARTAIDVCMHMDGAWRSEEPQMANVTAFLPLELLWSSNRGHDYGPYVQYLCMLMREQDLLLTQFSVVALGKTVAWPNHVVVAVGEESSICR